MQQQNQWWFANAHLADIEEENEEFALEGLVADAKPKVQQELPELTPTCQQTTDPEKLLRGLAAIVEVPYITIKTALRGGSWAAERRNRNRIVK